MIEVLSEEDHAKLQAFADSVDRRREELRRAQYDLAIAEYAFDCLLRVEIRAKYMLNDTDQVNLGSGRITRIEKDVPAEE